MVQVWVTSKEKFDYPPEWGVKRILDDLQEKIPAIHKRLDEDYAACQKLVASGVSKDCWNEYGLEALYGAPDLAQLRGFVEAQLQDLPMPIYQAVRMVAPWAFGPPLLLLIVGLALGWVVRGFRPHLSR